MKCCVIESLEDRRLLSFTLSATTPVANAAALTIADVQTILAQALSQARPTQAAAVVDREGTVLGMAVGAGAIAQGIAAQVLTDAIVRARTAAFFESNGEAFTTRTARFIIQDHFPPGIRNTAGGPLYGVQFSSLLGGDILLPSQTPAVSGDPGGVPLYINGVAVGGIGVAGDFRDIAARPELVPVAQDALNPDTAHRYNADPKGKYFGGKEEADFDEAVALAGGKGFLPPAKIRANTIFVGGLRLPFVAEGAANKQPSRTFEQLLTSGAASEYQISGGTFSAVPIGTSAAIAGEPEMVNATVDGVPGLIRDRANVQMAAAGVPAAPLAPHTNPQDSDPIVGSNDAGGLTAADVEQIISDAVDQAMITRAGIRKPNGVHAVVHIAVVDAHGNVLGVFRMEDGTNFSYDVAVQKARTALFFSDDTHAFSTRAIGFMSQRSFPPGIDSALSGPLFHLQDSLDQQPGNPLALRPQDATIGLADGITIFPGGVPLYKNGHLVGAIGVSGDGVDQDDLISYAGTAGFRPAVPIRSDELGASDIASFILDKIQTIQDNVPLAYDALETARKSLLKGLRDLRLPYVKFPREPKV